MPNDLIIQLAKILKRELHSYRESFNYYEIEIFVGCLIAESLRGGLLSIEESNYLRREVLGE